MRRMSKKRSAEERECRKMHDEYREMFPVCQNIDCHKRATDIHEIARGSHRRAARKLRSCILHLCRDCHDLMSDYRWTPLLRQLKVKKVTDPEGYNLLEFNAVRGRAPGAITEEEVDTGEHEQ